jgi:steroid 5-alpha reductase family enzyme
VTGFPWDAFGANLAVAAGASLTVLLACFVLALVKGVHRIVDVAWGVAFAAVATATYVTSGVTGGGGDGTRRLLLTVLTVAWGLRLAVHIGRRGAGHGEDPRYEKMLRKARGNPALYALRTVYLLQAALVWLVSLPVQAGQYVSAAPGVLVVLGVLVWAVGLFFEAVGDRQLHRFTSDPTNKGRVMDRGLWAWTRHPNYFGDFCVWWGLFLVAAGSWTAAALAVISPLVMSYLLIWGSGKRLLERHMADRPDYAEYASHVSGFFPLPPRPSASGRWGPGRD